MKLSVVSIKVTTDDINNTDSADWLPESGHNRRSSYQALVNFELVFDSSEDVLDVTLNFGGSDVDKYIGFERSKFEEMEREDHLNGSILILEVLAEKSPIARNGDDNTSPGDDEEDEDDDNNDDGGNSEKHHRQSKRNPNMGKDTETILRTFRANLTKAFNFDWSSRDKIASVSVSKGPISISNFTHFSLSKPIGLFELKTSFKDQSLAVCSEVLVTSSVEFDDSLGFHWACSNCSIIKQGIDSNGLVDCIFTMFILLTTTVIITRSIIITTTITITINIIITTTIIITINIIITTTIIITRNIIITTTTIIITINIIITTTITIHATNVIASTIIDDDVNMECMQQGVYKR